MQLYYSCTSRPHLPRGLSSMLPNSWQLRVPTPRVCILPDVLGR